MAGWLLGSLTLYAYLVLTAKQMPYQECMNCDEGSCEDCRELESFDQRETRLAA